MSDAAMAPAMAAALTEADVAGTWTGTSTPIGSDSVIAKWTQVCGAGSCRGTSEGSNVTIQSSYTLAGDSSVGVSQPYSEPSVKGGQVIDTWVGRLNGDNVSGTGAMTLASKPDSVVMRYRFAGSRVR
ncbi:MAG: hypothetical protein H0T48_13680 [Gemmatimonadaceae bacterium]|nr:hypothetical protein [Gemmatimonadaceae bacterium]